MLQARAMLKPGAAAPPPAAQLAEVDSTGRGCQPAHSALFRRGLALWHQASNLLRPGTSVSSGPGQAREERAARAGSGQGVKVHSGQWLAPVAEVAVLRVDQICAGATGHGWKQELNHLAEPLVPMGRTGPALRA